MFKITLSFFILIASNSYAQQVDFDKQFPLSDGDLYYPLIGENGELPSDIENGDGNYSEQPFNDISASPEEIIRVEEQLRLEQNNAQTLSETPENVYGEPSTALGYTPQSPQTLNEESDSLQQKPAKGSKSFKIEDLKRTNQITTEADLVEAEKAVTAMEETIESLIGASLIDKSETDTNQARPLNEFPNLTENKIGDIESFGLYTKETGGFDYTVWQGSNRKQVEKFFNAIRTSKIDSYTIKNELTKLLLTKAEKPEGESDKNWLAERASLLQHMGEASRAGLLISSAGINSKNVNDYNNIAQTWVENGLMHGNKQEICPFIKQNILNTDTPFWHKALLVCQLLSRDLKGLELSTSMLTEKMRRTDPLLFLLLDTIQGHSETGPLLSPTQTLKPLHSVIYAESPALLTPNVIPLLPDVVLRRVAKNVTLPITVRIQASEVLVNNFNEMNDIALLGLLYDKVEFDEKIINSPGVDRYAEEEVDGSLARALLWQGSKTSGLPSTRALTLKGLWERAERENLYRLAARLTPNLRKISSDSNLAWLAPEVVTRSLSIGKLETAKKWWKTLKKNNSLSRELMKKRDELQIIFAFIEGEINQDIFNKWVENNSFFDENARSKLQRTLTFLEASEIDFPVDIWNKLYETLDGSFSYQGKEVNSLWLRLLGAKLESQNVAGSIMLLSEPLLNTNINDLSEQTAGNIVTGFRFLGMNSTAKMLILEALIVQK